MALPQHIQAQKDALKRAVRLALTEAGGTLRELATKTGVSKSHLGELRKERTHIKFNLETLLILADYFGLTYSIQSTFTGNGHELSAGAFTSKKAS